MSVAQLDNAVTTEASALTILHVTAPASVGGLERVVEALGTGHVRRGHAVHVAAVIGPAEPEPSMICVLREAGVTVHVLRAAARAYRAERAFIARLCRELRPDVVHTHGFRSDVIDGGVARRQGIPIVTTVHGFTRNPGRGRIYEWLQRRSHRRFDAVVAVSQAQREELYAAGVPAARLQVLRNAWPDGGAFLDRAAARAALSIPQDAVIVGWVGRLSQEKGPDLFIEALARCPSPWVHAAMVGDGRLRAGLEGQARALGIADRITFFGQLADAHRYFAAFDLFVMSSRTEGAPIVLFEAMAAGVPIVATAVGGIPEIVARGEATLVATENPAALAEAICATLCNPERIATQTRAARETLRFDYSYDRWLAAYESLYRRLAGLKPQRTVTVS